MLTIWSKPQVMKSMNCISAMGRMPMMAAPTAEPMIAASAIGVSLSGASIQGVDVTWVVRARLDDNGNRAVGGKNVIGDVSAIRGGTLLREANGIIHDGFDLCFDLALNSLCQDVFLREIGFKAFDGVFFQPLFAQFRRHIIGFVCLGVTAHAECFAFDQRGTIAAAHMV